MAGPTCLTLFANEAEVSLQDVTLASSSKYGRFARVLQLSPDGLWATRVQAITAFQQDLAELQQLQQQEGIGSTGKEEEEEEITPIYEAEAEETSDEAWDHEEWVEQATRATPQGPAKIHRAQKGKHDTDRDRRPRQALWANEARENWLEPEQAPIDSHTWRDGLVEEDLGSDDDDGRLGRSDSPRAQEVEEEAAARSQRSSRRSEAARSRTSTHSGVDRHQEEEPGRDR